ncbi:MAG TPA: hypothetical protein VJC09_00500 [Candidatus Saccharimonadales bacterium]|nr:hypothetical protein [Candidatus Saccharimonadales bacterium]
MKKHIKHTLILAVLWGGLLVFLLSTNPTKLSIAWLIVPFIWLFASLYYTVQLIIDVFRPSGGRHSRRRVSITAVSAAIPTLLLLLDSINQLSVKDILIVVALGIGGLFYITKLRFKQPIS